MSAHIENVVLLDFNAQKAGKKTLRLIFLIVGVSVDLWRYASYNIVLGGDNVHRMRDSLKAASSDKQESV